MKGSKLLLLKLVTASFFGLSSYTYAGNVGYSSLAGTFVSQAGVALTAGGISIGFFPAGLDLATIPWPTLAADAAAAGTSVYTRLVTVYGYKDVRSVTANQTTDQPSNWTFPTPGPTGTASNIDTSAAGAMPVGTQLFALAFNSGVYNSVPALSWLNASEWAAVCALTSANGGGTGVAWLAPAGVGTLAMNLGHVNTVPEVKIGTDTGTDIRMAPVPEPSSVILLSSGLLGLISLRRRASQA